MQLKQNNFKTVETVFMGKVSIYDKIMIENQKKREKIRNQRNVYINLHRIDGLGMEFTAC